MANYIGDFALGDTFDTKICTVQSTGAPITLAGSPVISAYVGNSTTELTAGITLTVDFDSRTGMHNIRVVATAGNGYATATNYQLVITTGTINAISAVGYVVAEFSIENRFSTVKGVPGSSLPVGAYPALGILDSGTAQSATSTGIVGRSAAIFDDNSLKGATLFVFGSTQGFWQRRIITANLLSGDAYTVDTWDTTPTGTITYIIFGTPPASASGTLPSVNATQWLGTAISTPATAGIPDVSMKNIANQTVTAAAGVTFPSSVASPTNITAGTITTVTTVTNGLPQKFTKNTALASFPFLMRDSTNHAPATGLTVTATRSLDGAAFASCANAVSEISGGWYKISFAATDTNADTVAFRFTATAADDAGFTVVTQKA